MPPFLPYLVFFLILLLNFLSFLFLVRVYGQKVLHTISFPPQ
jgi:hypothetical protein